MDQRFEYSVMMTLGIFVPSPFLLLLCFDGNKEEANPVLMFYSKTYNLSSTIYGSGNMCVILVRKDCLAGRCIILIEQL